MKDVYIVEAVRSPIGRGKNNGGLHDVHPVELLAQTLKHLVQRAKVKPSDVDDVVCGCVTPVGAQGADIGRLAALKAGFPITVPGMQLNRLCGSAQTAIHLAAMGVGSGEQKLVIACGVEMMGVVPMGSDSQGVFTNQDAFFSKFPYKLVHQGVSAELLAEKYGVVRKECDEFASRSHALAHDAIAKGYWKNQIGPIEVVTTKDGAEVKTVVSADEGVRHPSPAAALAKLPTIFKPKGGGVVTAGNASQVSDGAAAVLIASGAVADKMGLKKRARIVATATVGSDPTIMLDGVIPATKMVLEKAGLKVDDIDVFEVNEAFASVVLAWQKMLKVPMEKVNPNGGAIAHGHPLGATGCVLMTKLVNELERRKARYGLQVMCIGHGMATATIIENVTNAKAGPTSKL